VDSVLIIEDEPNIRAFVRINLKVRGYIVFEAESAEEGISILKQTSPSLIILDYLLPGQTGEAVLQMMSQDKQLKHIPVILMSASVNASEANFPNITRRLTKPVNVDTLVDAVKGASAS
jgi:two-component system, OmpR family, phosphate regulon response regulator PhoB